jgi:hypothetical protein
MHFPGNLGRRYTRPVQGGSRSISPMLKCAWFGVAETLSWDQGVSKILTTAVQS